MRKIFILYLLFTIITIIPVFSNNKEGGSIFHFGSGTFNEPFCGVLKKRPQILVNSLKYPPFKWFSPDTIKLNKTFIIEFNEEAIRSKSKATIFFADTTARPIEGISFIYNGNKNSKFTFKVTGEEKNIKLNVTLVINPNIGEKEINGNVYICGEELDEVNNIPIQNELNVIDTWECYQEISLPFLLYFLWFITLLLFFGISIAVLYYLFRSFLILLMNILEFILSTHKRINKFQYSPKEASKENEQKNKKIGYGYFFNEKKELFILNKDFIIPNGNQHKNPQRRTSGEIAKLLGDLKPEIKFKNGYPIFDRDGGTKSGKPLYIYFEDGIKKYLKEKDLLGTGRVNREKLHIETFKLMAKKYGISYEELQIFKGNSEYEEHLAQKWKCSIDEVWRRCRNPYKIARVLHEHEDCKTVILVPWLYHYVDHEGGIKNLRSISKK